MEGHTLDEDGGHEPEACYSCLLTKDVKNECRCGECCHLLIEALPKDAEREPKIKEKGSPIYAKAPFTASGQDELEGYLLNSKDNGYACTFLDRETNLCTIYETRPLLCRLFDCEGDGREQLIELGVIQRRDA